MKNLSSKILDHLENQNFIKPNSCQIKAAKKIIQKAITHVNLIKQSDDYSLIELNPITGRKHQLRKQLYAIGQPIFGDTKYRLSNSTKCLTNVNNIIITERLVFKNINSTLRSITFCFKKTT